MTTLASERPAYAHARARQFSQRARCGELQRRLAGIDPTRTPRAHAVIEDSLRVAVLELQRIDADVDAARDGEVLPPAAEAVTTPQARSLLRNRLLHLAVALDRNLPPELAEAAVGLRRKIDHELTLLEE